MPEITIATSIAPRNFELQRAAIASWLNLGFKVVSLNSREEIELLSPEFPEITFASAPRTAQELAGKPYVFFDDLLAVLHKSGSEICGIINSDIHLRVGPDFVEQVRKTAVTDFLYASRVDVATTTDAGGEIYPYGFDLFFFPRKLTLEYPTSNFCLGVPWWDYWVVLVPVAKGFVVKEILARVAFHVIHESKWQNDLHGFFSRHLLEQVQSSALINEAQCALIKELSPAYEANNFFLVSLLYLKYIQQQTEPMLSKQWGVSDSYMSNQYVIMRNELVEEKIRVYYLSGELERLRAYIATLNSDSGSLSDNSAEVKCCEKDCLLCRFSRRLFSRFSYFLKG